MENYAVFLRGINVGGINIKMADLKAALKDYPFTKVKTLLASGNVVLQSELGPAEVKSRFEECLRESFGYDAWVVVLTAARVAELVEACPYPADDKSTHSYVTLTSDEAMLDELFDAGEAWAVWSRSGWDQRHRHGWLQQGVRWTAPSASYPPRRATKLRPPPATSAR